MKSGDIVYVKKMRKTALESPTAGPFTFMNYTDNRKVACKIKNIVSNRTTTVSTSNIVIDTKLEESENFVYDNWVQGNNII